MSGWSETVNTANKAAQPPADTQGTSPSLVQGLENVFTSGLFSDLTITCKDRTWKAHKLVVCTQSPFFLKACEDGFKEADTNTVDLRDDDPEIVETLLYYLYHFDYKDEEKEGGIAPLLLHTRIFVLADKYFIEPLQSLATERFNIRATEEWNTDAFTEALLEVYGSDFQAKDADLLRFIILENVKRHAKELFNNSESHALFRSAALAVPDFLMAYAKELTAESNDKMTLPPHTGLTWYRCPAPNCRRHNAVFGVGPNVPGRFHMNCPLRCEQDRDMEWWRAHKTTM